MARCCLQTRYCPDATFPLPPADRSTIIPHDHEEAAVSGVFYVATPPAAGNITFEDPRVARLFWSQSPFAQKTVDHEPQAGELLLFPPWLVHSVGSSEGASAPRVSLSFNFFTTAREEESGRLNREALAETACLAGGVR